MEETVLRELNEKDFALIDEISTLYNINKEIVEKFYKEMLQKCQIKKKRESHRKAIIKILGPNNLSEQRIEKFCVSKGVPKLSETIYLFLNNTLEETADILGVENSTVTRRIQSFLSLSKD